MSTNPALPGDAAPGPKGSAPVPVSYLIFNTPWDAYLLDRYGFDNSRFSDTPHSNPGIDLDVRYLLNSILSLSFGVPRDRFRIIVWVVELDANDVADRIEELLGRVFPGCPFEVRRIARGLFDHLLRREIALPPSVHKSPNRIHELCLYHMIRETPEARMCVSDPDTLFLSPGMIDTALAPLGGAGEKVVSAFFDAEKRLPERYGDFTTPPRMHTVFLAVDAFRLGRLVDLQADLDLQNDFDARIRLIRNERRQDFYRRSKWADTLSFLTEYLTGNFETDLTVNLNHVFEGYFEAGLMTLGCEEFLHAKYLNPGTRQILDRNLESRPRMRRGFQRILNLVATLRRTIPGFPGDFASVF